MNEKGFATILGLCLILAIALVVKGIQEAEMNHAYETADFEVESALQHAAELGIYAAAEIVRNTPDILLLNENPSLAGNGRDKYQKQLIPPTNKFSDKNIKVEVWGERILFRNYKVKYGAESETDSSKENVAELIKEDDEVYIFFSRAEVENDRTGGQIYRRAFAYILVNDADMKIHFMGLPTRNYTFAN